MAIKLYGFSKNGRLKFSQKLGVFAEKLATFMLGKSVFAATAETKRRIALLAGISLVGCTTLLIFGMVALFQSSYLLGAFDVLMAVVLILNLVDARVRQQYPANITLGVTLTSIFYIYLYTNGGLNQTAYVWYFTYPLIACVMLGHKKGAIAAALMTIPVIAIMVFRPSHAFFASYTFDFEFRFLCSYLVVGIFSVLIENSAEANRKELHQVNQNLEHLISVKTKELMVEIEERNRTQSQLIESEHSYRTMFEKSVNGVFLIDRSSGRYLDANPAAERLTGRSHSELCGLSLEDVTPFLSMDHLEDLFSADFSVHTKNVSYFQPDGNSREAVLKATPLNNKLVMVIAEDVTELKVAENERIKLQTQLHQAKRLESIGTLAGGIAHDFNNILSSIMGYTELSLLGVSKGSQLEKYMQEVLTAGKRARDLVAKILTFAKQKEGEMKPVRVDLIVLEVLELLRSSLPSYINISHNIKAEAVVMAEESQIHQILMNLCTNATHAMENRAGVLTVHVSKTIIDSSSSTSLNGLMQGEYVKVQVIDTGRGIEPKVITSIFEPYYTTKGIGKGTGLGLSVVHGAVKTLGGEIFVTTELGKGTEFTLYLPAAKQKYTKEKLDNEDLPGGKERILIVDDEPTIVDSLSVILESLGYAVTTKTCSLEAFDLFSSKPDAFDLVITDMTMPYMTGELLAGKLLEMRPKLPILLCTGYSNSINEERAMNLGIKGFAYKPVVIRELAKTVRKILD